LMMGTSLALGNVGKLLPGTYAHNWASVLVQYYLPKEAVVQSAFYRRIVLIWLTYSPIMKMDNSLTNNFDVWTKSRHSFLAEIRQHFEMKSWSLHFPLK
jgi:hypothetical protein